MEKKNTEVKNLDETALIAKMSKRKKMFRIFSGVLAGIALASGGYWYFVASYYVSTDNAYVSAEVAQVTPSIDGTVKTINVTDTQPVKAGDVLVVIDDIDARLALARATGAFVRAQSDAERAKLDLERRKAVASSGSISREELTTAENAHRVALALCITAKAAMEQAQVDLGRTVIKAPIDGVVVARNVDVGQTVAASLQAPVLFTIAQDLRAMQVDASIDEADVGAMQVGQKVGFTVDAYPGRTFEGEVLQIRKSPQVVQNVVTYDVVVSAPNPDLALLPGLTANVRVVTAERTGVLQIPNSALRYGQAQAAKAAVGAAALPAGTVQVYSLGSDGTPQPVAVKLGISDGNVTEMVEGPLTEGQQLVIGEVPAGGAKSTNSLPGFGAGPRM